MSHIWESRLEPEPEPQPVAQPVTTYCAGSGSLRQTAHKNSNDTVACGACGQRFFVGDIAHEFMIGVIPAHTPRQCAQCERVVPLTEVAHDDLNNEPGNDFLVHCAECWK